MYPVAWFPMVDPNETYSIDYIKTNKGLGTIYRDNIQFNGEEAVKQFFGWCPKFTPNVTMSFKLDSSLGEHFQKGFGITATIYMKETCAEGQLFKISNDRESIEIGYGDWFYIRDGANSARATIGDGLISHGCTYNIAVVFNGIELRVYLNKVCVYTSSRYYPSTNLENTFVVGGAGPFTMMNLKIYDSELSMRQLLEDYALLYGHYKFDGSVIDDTPYSTEYDCSGIGIDVTDNHNFSLTSTYSPIRQYSSVTSDGFTLPAGHQFYTCAWINVYTMDNIIFGAEIGDQRIISIGRNGNEINIEANRECSLIDGIQTIPYRDSEWIFVEFSLRWTNSSPIFKFRVTKPDEEPIIVTEYTFNRENIESMTIRLTNGMAVSDLRVYMNPITEAEIAYLFNRNVHIDDKGTLYATELQELDHMSTFGFGDRGQIMAPEFTDDTNLGETGVMQYDYLNNIMSINNFKEV